MHLLGQKCAICACKTTGFHYGVPSCNACKTFFKRCLNSKKFRKCVNGGACPQNSIDCRFCRFQQCIRSGMMAYFSENIRKSQLQNSDNLSLLLQKLSIMDSARKNLFLNYQLSDDVGLNDVISSSSVHYTPKPVDFSNTFYDWVVIDLVTTLDFMKRQEFVKFLAPDDVRTFLLTSFFQCATFSSAVRCSGENIMSFPGGVDIFPFKMSSLNPKLLQKIRSELVERVNALKMTSEEFLLLTLIFICNSVNNNLSESGRSFLGSYQKIYSSALLQYTMITHRQAGPSRFQDLLSLCHVLNTTLEGMGCVAHLFRIKHPAVNRKQLYQDIQHLF
ncbi:unnamed protein product [Caenorhabditis sp. 36 PRJEB53466]|nr:unnamed protein product [Caenorhabditis sp. 36 PRJEB53466]